VESTKRNALEDAMSRMWAQFLPDMNERVDALEQAAQALVSGSCTPELLQAAYMEAHKLSGVLGTFGLMEGTEVAREAELIYHEGAERASAEAARLLEITTQLRRMIADKK
jgi:HPt (histidine-containing phosphotransfer) domain-containing protein